MLERVKVADIELSDPPRPLEGLDGYRALRALVRLHGVPLGILELPVSHGRLTMVEARRVILRRLSWPIVQHHLKDLTATPLRPEGPSVSDLLEAPHARYTGSTPLITVAVCTRDRPDDLRLCLDSISRMDYPNLDVVVVDNAPKTGATQRLVSACYPHMRYVCEPRPGLNWARNRAIAVARGEIIAYTDDDVVVDRGWATALAEAFEDAEVMAVTGLVEPYELETPAQIIFQRYGGFHRGFTRRHWRIDPQGNGRLLRYLGAGQYGTGANMAYRLSLFDHVGRFDLALDVGTVTNGGGDLDMFFRVLKEGHLLVYDHTALVRHNHRRDYAQLRTQIASNGIGFYSYLVRTALAYPDARGDVLRFGLWWFCRWSLLRLLASFIRPGKVPRDLIWAELWGSVLGLGRYPKARLNAARLGAAGGDKYTRFLLPSRGQRAPSRPTRQMPSVCVRSLDLSEPLEPLRDVADCAGTRVFVSLGNRLIGAVTISNAHQPISVGRLREAIIGRLGLRLLRREPEMPVDGIWAAIRTALRLRYEQGGVDADDLPETLPEDVPVSVVVATYDRPDDLRNCLRSLRAQKTSRTVEIIVVDNHPTSGLTPPVVAEFPGVVLVEETRQGLSYARNKGIVTTRGDIVISTDDDVSAPVDWLEKIVAPFVHSDVMIVTGNTLPLELETHAQRSFERYGGLGRGFEQFELDGTWFNSFRRTAVPTWVLGATANAAFRASIFSHAQIGLMDEALGAGTPTGVGEDTYLFYKVLKAGYTIVYEPGAYVWHKHRRDMAALHKQIYSYSKGHVGYHLTTLTRDHDARALMDLIVRLPRWHMRQLARHVKRRILGRSNYPLGLIWLEVKGNLAGPWGLWLSRRRVKREGQSDPYIPVGQRANQDA